MSNPQETALRPGRRETRRPFIKRMQSPMSPARGNGALSSVRMREKKCLRFEPYLSLMLQFCKKYVQ